MSYGLVANRNLWYRAKFVSLITYYDAISPAFVSVCFFSLTISPSLPFYRTYSMHFLEMTAWTSSFILYGPLVVQTTCCHCLRSTLIFLSGFTCMCVSVCHCECNYISDCIWYAKLEQKQLGLYSIIAWKHVHLIKYHFVTHGVPVRLCDYAIVCEYTNIIAVPSTKSPPTYSLPAVTNRTIRLCIKLRNIILVILSEMAVGRILQLVHNPHFVQLPPRWFRWEAGATNAFCLTF